MEGKDVSELAWNPASGAEDSRDGASMGDVGAVRKHAEILMGECEFSSQDPKEDHGT